MSDSDNEDDTHSNNIKNIPPLGTISSIKRSFDTAELDEDPNHPCSSPLSDENSNQLSNNLSIVAKNAKKLKSSDAVAFFPVPIISEQFASGNEIPESSLSPNAYSNTAQQSAADDDQFSSSQSFPNTPTTPANNNADKTTNGVIANNADFSGNSSDNDVIEIINMSAAENNNHLIVFSDSSNRDAGGNVSTSHSNQSILIESDTTDGEEEDDEAESDHTVDANMQRFIDRFDSENGQSSRSSNEPHNESPVDADNDRSRESSVIFDFELNAQRSNGLGHTNHQNTSLISNDNAIYAETSENESEEEHENQDDEEDEAENFRLDDISNENNEFTTGDESNEFTTEDEDETDDNIDVYYNNANINLNESSEMRRAMRRISTALNNQSELPHLSEIQRSIPDEERLIQQFVYDFHRLQNNGNTQHALTNNNSQVERNFSRRNLDVIRPNIDTINRLSSTITDRITVTTTPSLSPTVDLVRARSNLDRLFVPVRHHPSRSLGTLPPSMTNRIVI
jgi:hypothetical protein